MVVALPRGGVVTAYEVARSLGAPLDVLVSRKLGAVVQPEFGVGAIAPGGVRIVDRAAMALAGMDEGDLERVTRVQRAEMERRERLYRAGRPPVDVRGRTAILVDDGVATGVTVRAGVASLRALGAARVVLAVGVCPPDTARELERIVDELVCVGRPRDLVAVGCYFEDFRQIEDDEVVELLERAAAKAEVRSAC